MANKVRVKMSISGANAVRNTESMQRLLLSRAEAIRDAANAKLGSTSLDEAYTADVRPGKGRARAMVKTTGHQSRRDNARNNTLLKSLGG